jgi:hypothetical protein
MTVTAEEWIEAYCARHQLDWDQLNISSRNSVMVLIPCSVRCYRVGVAIAVRPGEACPECGFKAPLPTSWDRILADDPQDNLDR